MDSSITLQTLFAEAIVALERCRHEDVLALTAQILSAAPAHIGTLYLRAHALMEMPERSTDSQAAWEEILTLTDRPEVVAVAANNIGTLHRARRRFELAETFYRRALEAEPASAVTHNNLGVLYKETHRLQAAEAAYRRALELDPNGAKAYVNLGALLGENNRHLESILACETAIRLNPDSVLGHFNLGCALNKLGHSREAIESYKQALRIDPEHLESLTNLLFALNFVAEAPLAETLEYARWFGSVTRGKALAYSAWNVEVPAAKLRIGLVSGDMLDHPVGYFLEELVSKLDVDRFALYGYMTCDRSSALTDRIRPFFTEWRMVQHLGDEELAKCVWDDGIHILIDLAGHTGFNRLAMFSRRPAPVQASWLGYFATTGVADIDYVIADMTSVPPEHEWHFIEAVWRLPETRLCFTPPHGAPAVRNTPAIRNGYITFGCFQDLTKMTDRVLDAWSKILHSHKSARLRLQTNRFSNPAHRSSFTQRLIGAQIDIARIDIHSAVPRNAYLDAYGEVDLLLDTFPFPGGTTTAEALFMGVPTVTIMGDRLISRQGAGLLLSAGLAGWIANEPIGYIGLALSKAADIDALQALRMSLRERALRSPLFDARSFANNFGAAMADMWCRWLAERS